MAKVVTCNCVEEMDALLAPKNTSLRVLAIPSFCPFCGVAYNHKTEEKADG